MDYQFYRKVGRIITSGQTHSVVLTGNIDDLFHLAERDDYVTIQELLQAKWGGLKEYIFIVAELNGPIRFFSEADRDAVRKAWVLQRTGMPAATYALSRVLESRKGKETPDHAADFDRMLLEAAGNPQRTLEVLRQLCLCSRMKIKGEPLLPDKNLIILIESADMLIPAKEIAQLSDSDRRSVSICADWFSDPGFCRGKDAVVLLAESRSSLNPKIARLPQLVTVEIPSPDIDQRIHAIKWYDGLQEEGKKLKLWREDVTTDTVAMLTAGLSVQALMQLLRYVCHFNETLTPDHIVAMVEEYIKSQLGEDVVEFLRPTHTLKDVIGFSKLKEWMLKEIVPRIQSPAKIQAVRGVGVAGPLGAGKTFIWSAIAGMLGIPVLILKNIRSQWFGQTDVIFERLRRVLQALSKVLIFVDEADTMFGGVGPDSHETERRLTGKIQAMMSDPALRGKVTWFLMTARIHLLSPDIRRIGRLDAIVPVLDPVGEDRTEFLRWITDDFVEQPDITQGSALEQAIGECSAAGFDNLRTQFARAKDKKGGKISNDDAVSIARDIIPPDIDTARRIQELYALRNCTVRTLLPDPNVDIKSARTTWAKEIAYLESAGARAA